MDVVYGLEQVGDGLRGCALTIGNFDGVHRGHQQIIAQAGLLADRTNERVVVLTFDPHPLEVVAPQRAPAKLMPLKEKVRWLCHSGADCIVVARSEPRLLALSAEAFIEQIVVRRFGPAHVVEGWSFGFGKDRQGSPQLLEALGRQHGFGVFVVEPVRLQVARGETVRVSSSLIRDLVMEGRVHEALLCLGRPYALFGVVEQGRSRGTGLGFPTANLGRITQLVPAEGVYAGVAEVGGATSPAAISVGTTPTFEGRCLQVEAHILGINRDLYGQNMRLEFWRHLRSQRKFDGPASLRTQLSEDVDRVRTLARQGGWKAGTD